MEEKINKKIKVIGEGYKIKEEVIKKKRQNKKLKSNLFALEYVNIGWYIIIPILVFLGLGIALAKFLKIVKIIIVLFLFLGVIGSFYNIFKVTQWKK